MTGLQSYRHGRIVWAYLIGRTGKREIHPAIIVDADEDIVQPENFDPRQSQTDNILYVVGVSTKYKQYATPSISLPFDPTGHASTKLKEDCAAIIGWYAQLAIPDDVIGFAGDVPHALMKRINDTVRRDLAGVVGRQFDTVREMFDELFDEIE